MDRGANGGILGNDALVINKHLDAKVDVTGIDNHEMTALPLVDAAAKVRTNYGWKVIILHRYAYYGVGKTIHSCAQIEAFGNTVYDRSLNVKDGGQCIVSLRA